MFVLCRSVCGPVGVEDRNKIPDARMTASTFYDSRYHPYYGRLNENRGLGGWCTKTTTDRTDYLQVDMGAVRSVCAVATQEQGAGPNLITSYKAHLSTDGVTWISYKENNVEKVTKIIHACLEVAVYKKIINLSKQDKFVAPKPYQPSPVLVVYKGCTYRYILQRNKSNKSLKKFNWLDCPHNKFEKNTNYKTRI